MNRDGSCTKCDDFYKLSDDGQACDPYTCPAENRVTLEGDCIPCVGDERLVDNACIEQQCEENEYALAGICERCDDYQVGAPDKRSCVDKECGARAKVERNGKCTACDDYWAVDTDKRSCIEPDCEAREIVLDTGVCDPCGNYEVPDGQKITCIDPECGTNNKIETNGECTPCPGQTVLSENKRSCDQPDCGI